MVAGRASHLNVGSLESPRVAPAVPAEAPDAPPCVLVNPRSFRASRGLALQAASLAQAHGAQVVQVHDAATIRTAVESILARRQRHVAVLAGDGTVHAVVDQLAQLPPGAWIPDLLILPGGRSNLTASEFVPAGRALATLRRALALVGEQGWDAAVVERAILRVEQAPAPPRHGFFIGGALVDSVVRECHRYRTRSRSGMSNARVGTAWCLAKIAARAAVGRSPMSCPTLDIDAGPCGRLQGPTRVLLATTLSHAGGWFNPYAARGEGELRVTAVALGARAFYRSLPRLLTQRFSRAMDLDHGYLSGRCPRLAITGLPGYSLDGEEFDCDPARPVLVTPGPRLRFLTLR